MLPAIGLRHQEADIPAHHFDRRKAEQLLRRRAEGLHDAARVYHDHGVGDGGEHRLQMRLAFLEGDLGLPRRRDVARDFRGADQRTLAIPDGRDAHRHIYDCPVLAAAAGLEMVNLLPGADAGQNGVFFGLHARRQQPCDGLPDHLPGAVAKDPLRGAIPVRDDAVHRLADDGIVRRGDDGCQPAVGDLLGPVAADIHQDAVRFVAGLGTAQQVPPDTAKRKAEVEAMRSARKTRLQRIAQNPAIVGMNQRQELVGRQVRRRRPQQRAGLRGQLEKPAGRRPPPHPGAGGGQRRVGIGGGRLGVGNRCHLRRIARVARCPPPAFHHRLWELRPLPTSDCPGWALRRFT